jgi:hypothetical protein
MEFATVTTAEGQEQISLNHDVGNEHLVHLQSSLDEEDEDELNQSIKQEYESYVVGLKEREAIAKAAYKTWFKIKPGNKEIKDKWWALYYKKLIPKYQLR